MLSLGTGKSLDIKIGNGGLTKQFYVTFCDDIKVVVMVMQEKVI